MLAAIPSDSGQFSLWIKVIPKKFARYRSPSPRSTAGRRMVLDLATRLTPRPQTDFLAGFVDTIGSKLVSPRLRSSPQPNCATRHISAIRFETPRTVSSKPCVPVPETRYVKPKPIIPCDSWLHAPNQSLRLGIPSSSPEYEFDVKRYRRGYASESLGSRVIRKGMSV